MILFAQAWTPDSLKLSFKAHVSLGDFPPSQSTSLVREGASLSSTLISLMPHMQLHTRAGLGVQLLIFISFWSCLIDVLTYRITMTEKLYSVSIEDIFSDTIIASTYCETSNQYLFTSITFVSPNCEIN